MMIATLIHTGQRGRGRGRRETPSGKTLIYRITDNLNILLLLYLLQDGVDVVDENVEADKDNKGADAAQQPSVGKRKNGNSWKTSRQTLLPLQQPPAVNSQDQRSF